MDSTSGSYGASKAGIQFDFVSYFKKPQVILKLISLLFSVIVFGCTSDSWYNGKCAYNYDSNACNYGTGIGVIAFLALIIFLVTDALFEKISSVQHRKYLIMAELGFSGFWTFLWFVGFCYLTNKWTNRIDDKLIPNVNTAQAAIAFSFFSIISWAGITYFALSHYRMGSQGAFQSSDEIERQIGTGYSPYPSASDHVLGGDANSVAGGTYQQNSLPSNDQFQSSGY